MASSSFPMVIKRFVHWVGSTKPAHLSGPWPNSVTGAVEKIGDNDPRVACAEIKGSHPHKSHNDPSDPEDVVSVVLRDELGKRIVTIHVHEDGSHTTPQKK